MVWTSKPPVGTLLDQAHPRNRKLVTYFPFLEGGGGVVRNLATPQTSTTCTPPTTGVLTNFVQGPTSGWSGGRSGSALRFDGTNDYVLLTANKLLGEATISAWIRPSTVAAGTRCIIDDDVGGASRSFAFEINRTAARLSCLVAGTVALTSSTNLVVDTWYHVAAVRTGSSGNWTYTIYVNGTADGTATVGNDPLTTASAAYIGSRAGGDRFFAGDLSDFKAWDRALRPQEVMEDFTEPYAVFREPGGRKWYVTASGTGVGNADGVATADGVGKSLADSVGNADGVGSTSGIAKSLADSVGNADGIASVAGFGASLFEGVGNADGVGTAEAFAPSVASGTGNADGVGTAEGVSAPAVTIDSFYDRPSKRKEKFSQKREERDDRLQDILQMFEAKMEPPKIAPIVVKPVAKPAFDYERDDEETLMALL